MGVCRSVDVAKRELRWMEDEILRLDVKTANRFLEKYRLSSVRPEMFGVGINRKWEKLLLAKFVEERAKGTPFQYVVGSSSTPCLIFVHLYKRLVVLIDV